MVMDMGRDASQGVVELTYEPVMGDFMGALKERNRLRKRGWLRSWAVGLLAFAFVLNAALSVAGRDKPDWVLLIWLPLALVLLLLTPRLQARAFLKLAARNGTYRASVTDAGLTMVTDNSTTSVKWAAQPRYRETGDAFFTYSDDKNASCFTVLPKRGLAGPADADRLREILDRNLTRV
ncbi:YcxB family protein [Streptomyces sp. NPDC059690]|uniref:YcxB family protein n=1 Tax=Streptomyces sp. NPDC059690 TaxID=3346907 RepID=UPI0036B5E0B6